LSNIQEVFFFFAEIYILFKDVCFNPLKTVYFLCIIIS
jgi:hypothetical protein